jgi:hypothetical protein
VGTDFDKWFFAAVRLFHDISIELGKTDARRIFKEIAGPATPKQRAGWKNLQLITLYDCMKQPNVQQLARELAEKNCELPQEQRYGPTGSTNWEILDKHIRRLIRHRRKLHGY